MKKLIVIPLVILIALSSMKYVNAEDITTTEEITTTQEIEVVEDKPSEMNEWFESKVVTLIGTFLSTLGGSGVALGLLIKFILNAKNENGKLEKDLSNTIKKVDDLCAVVNMLNNAVVKIDYLYENGGDIKSELDNIKKGLIILAKKDETNITDGTVKEIANEVK